jgi:hypothetical protein
MDRPTWKKRLRSLGPEGGFKGDSDRVRVTAVVAVALAVGFLVWLLLIKGDGNDGSSQATEPTTSSKQVSLVSESELLGALRGVGYPVYWAGPRLGVGYEVTRLTDGRTYVRYLPEGEEVESKTPFLTVGSYEQGNALDEIRKLGQKPGAVLVEIAGGGSAYAEGPDATSAYMAFPGVDTQVEVYDPQGGRALKLIRSGAIVPVG